MNFNSLIKENLHKILEENLKLQLNQKQELSLLI